MTKAILAAVIAALGSLATVMVGNTRACRFEGGLQVVSEIFMGTWTLRPRLESRWSGRGSARSRQSLPLHYSRYGVRGGRLLAPGFGSARIAQAVTAEVGWVEDGNFNDWIPRQNSYVGADFPRTISWGIDAHGRGWLQIKTLAPASVRGSSASSAANESWITATNVGDLTQA
jgi:hypothetical protein